MPKNITITMPRDQWVGLGKFVSREFGRSFDPMPIINLVDQLARAGISTEEMSGEKEKPTTEVTD